MCLVPESVWLSIVYRPEYAVYMYVTIYSFETCFLMKQLCSPMLSSVKILQPHTQSLMARWSSMVKCILNGTIRGNMCRYKKIRVCSSRCWWSRLPEIGA